MWGLGCILAELFTRHPMLQGKNQQNQLKLISELCGNITPESYPGVEKLKLYNKIDLPKGNKNRIIPWLKMAPLPCELTSLLSKCDGSNFEYLVAQRKNERQRNEELQQQQIKKRKL